MNRMTGLVVLSFLFLAILAPRAAAQLSLGRSVYTLGEPVTMTVALPAGMAGTDAVTAAGVELRVAGPTGTYRYLGAFDRPLIFYPKEAGDYRVTLAVSDRNGTGADNTIDEVVFAILPPPDAAGDGGTGSSGAGSAASVDSFILTQRHDYALGEQVIIDGDVRGIAESALVLETPLGDLRYGGTLEFPITYVPDVPGRYRLVVWSAGKEMLAANFSVLDDVSTLLDDGKDTAGQEMGDGGNESVIGNGSAAGNGSSVGNAPASRDGSLVLADAERGPALLRPRHALEARTSKGRFVDATIHAVDLSGKATNAPGNGSYREVDLTLAYGPVKRLRLHDALLAGDASVGLDEVPVANVRLSFGAGRGFVPKAFAIDTGNVSFANGTATVIAVGTELWKCAAWNFSAQRCDGSWTLAMRLTPGEPYEIPLFPGDPGYAETGIASVNTLKPLYHPGETADIVIVVLNTSGMLVTGANVTLLVTDPANVSTPLSSNVNCSLNGGLNGGLNGSMNGSLNGSLNCSGTIVETQRGVYETNYTIPSLEGNYSLHVTAVSAGVNSSMDSSFTALASYPYDILRDAPVTTDPWQGSFNASITVDALNGSSPGSAPFSLTERLPDAFTVSDAGSASVSLANGSHLLTWTNLSDGATVTYAARPPYASPDLYILGPATVDSGFLFPEARPWYLAIDPTNAEDRFNASTGNSGHIRDRNCGTTGSQTRLMNSGNSIYVGRYTTGSGREYRMFVDFDTSAIPDNAVINSATLYVYLNTENGEPADAVSVYSCSYGGTLTNADYGTTLGYNHGTIFTGSSSTGQYHSLALGTGDGNISLTGDTQLCIWIDGGCSDTNDLFNTLSTNSGNQPYLMVNYSYNSVPTQGTPLLESSLGYNETTEDLLCYNQSTADADGDSIRNIYTWSVNGTPFEILNTPFEGGSNSTWTKDYSGNANDGVVSGASWNRSDGKVGGDYEFDGSNDYIRFQGDNLSTTNHSFTVSFWFKPANTVDSSIASKIALIEKREGGGKNDWYINFDTGDAGRMRWRSYSGNVQTTTNSWTAGTWYHVAFVYTSNTNATIYVNGMVDNRNNDYNIGTLTQSVEDIWVGTRHNGNDDFNGSIDELRIYGSALSAAQVARLYALDYATLKSAETTVGDNWTCSITPNDGYADGASATSNQLTVLASTGSPPNITSVSDSPDPVALGSNLNITATVTDPDGDLQTVEVEINGTNYSMSNMTPTSWNVTIDTTGFTTGLLTYTVYANDSAGKTASDSSGSVTVTNTLNVSVSVGSAPHYIGTTLNATTAVTIAGSPVGSAGVTTDIVRVETTSEPLTESWWNTSFKQRVKFTLADTSGRNRTDYWVSVPVTIDGDCSLDAHNTSLRLVDDQGSSLTFLQWNITACSGNAAYVRSLWISFRLNLTASQSRNFYLYADNASGHSQVGTTQGPLRIVYVDQGTGSGSFPDTTDIQSRYDAALGDLGLSSSGFYDTLSTSRSSSDVPYSSLSAYPLVHYSAGSKYRNSWSSVEAANLWQYVNQSGSLLMTGPELGFDADEDSWIFNNVWDNLTHMGSGFQDDTNPSNADVVASHPITAYLSSSFQVSDTYPDGYTTITGPVAVSVYDWDNGNPRAGTANDGLYDTSCPGMCGKTVYYAGAIVDTSGNGITVGADREKFLEGVLDWFLNNRSADFSSGTEQHWVARSNGSTVASGLLTLGFDS